MPEQFEHWIEEMLSFQETEKMTDKQVKIIQAAVEIFAEKGFASTSTNEIAQKAGVAEGTIFRHYKTKKDLLLSIVAPMMTRLLAPFILNDFNKVLNAPFAHFEDFLRAMIHNRLEFARNNQKVIKILLQEIPLHTELQHEFQEVIAKKVFARMQDIVQKFQKEGEIIPLPAYSVMRMSASVVLGYLLARFFMFPHYDWDDQEETEHMVQFILHGISAMPSKA